MSHELSGDPILRDVGEVEGYKVLGPCVLYSKIGQGGMGAVYRGLHVNLEIEVAVKCLLPALVTMDGDLITRFQREAQLAARVTHQNLVRVYDFGEQSDLHYLIMEYVTGESLRERVERAGASCPADAVTVIRQAAEGLAAAHEEEIVHRDIKPDNILISEKGVVKVADLGLGRIGHGQRDLTMSRVPMGTPAYMPPEQWTAIGRVGPEGDVWALGATLYFLLAGESAFQGFSMQEVQQRICDAPFPHDGLTEVPRDIIDILRRCTQHRPEDRYPSARVLADALHDVAEKHGFDGVLRTVVRHTVFDPSREGDHSVARPPRSVLDRVREEATPSRQATPSPEPTVALSSSRARWIAWGAGLAALVVVGLGFFLAFGWIQGQFESLKGASGTRAEGAASSAEPHQKIPGFRFERTNAQGYEEYRHEESDILMVLLSGGAFEMGSADDDERAQPDEKPRHRVTLSPFLIAKYEVSQKEWTSRMGSNPSLESDRGESLPVGNVSWLDCQDFCRETGLSFPTEAQWEYACRARSDGAFAFGATLGKGRANFDGDGPMAVDSFGPNDFGLFNMHGNAFEWCKDAYDERCYAKRKAAGLVAEDPEETTGTYRVLRGGNFTLGEDSCRSAGREYDEPDFADQTIGFRPVFNP